VRRAPNRLPLLGGGDVAPQLVPDVLELADDVLGDGVSRLRCFVMAPSRSSVVWIR
jgi:hypothetical protein